MGTDACDAPCIVNTAEGFSPVFCQKELGHVGEHSFNMLDQSGKEVTVEWNYLGQVTEVGDFELPPMLDQRCKDWAHIPLFKGFLPTPEKRQWGPNLMLFSVLQKLKASFCCGKTPGHDGPHIRSGVFGPLGIKWEIKW
ncbi:MAG: hypothetical protein NTU85_01445 [Candidatus Kaiserbacteria bacterium]|nr:hypothetical protein [Candidatus Kaiserbacteria bacterium]